MKAILTQKKLKLPADSRQTKSTRLTLEEQTRLSWASLITKYKEVPEEFSYFFEPLERANQPFPFCVVTPSYEGFLHRFQERLVCIIGQELFVLNKNKNAQEKMSFFFQGINCLEFKKILLDSSLTINGVDQKGIASSVDLHFNTVSEGLFWEIMRRVRQFFFTDTVINEKPIFYDLREQSFKFASYSRNCLIPGEKVIQLIWQPELKANRVNNRFPKLLRDLFERIVFPSHVILLTDQELILIREDERENRKEKYGAIWQFVPLEKIKDVTLTPREDDLLEMRVLLADRSSLTSLYSPTILDQLEQFLKAIKS